MKVILFVLLSASSLAACLDPGIEQTPTSEASTVDQAVAPAASQVCLDRCRDRYEACLEDAVLSIDMCLCYNNAVVCDRGCGVPGLPRQCL